MREECEINYDVMMTEGGRVPVVGRNALSSLSFRVVSTYIVPAITFHEMRYKYYLNAYIRDDVFK